MFSKGLFCEVVDSWDYKGKGIILIKDNTILGNLQSDLGFLFNPLPDKPILGSSNSKAIEDMMSKILTNGCTIF